MEQTSTNKAPRRTKMESCIPCPCIWSRLIWITNLALGMFVKLKHTQIEAEKYIVKWKPTSQSSPSSLARVPGVFSDARPWPPHGTSRFSAQLRHQWRGRPDRPQHGETGTWKVWRSIRNNKKIMATQRCSKQPCPLDDPPPHNEALCFPDA